jgi:hypothetical protein
MDLASIVGMLALAVSTGGADGLAPGAQETLPEPISTRQNLFSIPFHVDQPGQPDQEPVEVQLHVSVDRGATWHFYSKVQPKRGYFLFRAGGDGQFWFLIRTLDRNGRLRPGETRMPGLRVIVDTTPPKLELKAGRGRAGQVTAEWQVDDPNFDPGSLKIQYRTGENPIWQYVAIDRQDVQGEGALHRGEVSWWLPSDASRVEIRAEAADTAENPTVTHAQIAGEAPPAAASVPTAPYTPVPPAIEKPADEVAQGASQPAWRPSTDPPAEETWWSRTASDLPARDGPADAGPTYTFPPSSNTANPSPYAYAASVTTSEAPSAETTPPGSRHVNQKKPNTPQKKASPPSAPARDPVGSQDNWTGGVPRYPSTDPAEASSGFAPGEPVAADRPIPDQVVAGPESEGDSVAIQIHPAIRNQYVADESSPTRFDTSIVPPGEAVRTVGSRVFELEYDVESVGPSGIACVELWGTRDGGRTWSSFGVDGDNRSPFLVTVQEEGIYGFRVAVKNGAGMGGKKPRSGEKPDLWIGVDETRPTAEILGAEQAGGGRPGQLLIRWKADDAMLEEKPISLYFSDRVGGPWKPVAKDLENSGQYAWSPDGLASQRVFLRLEVRDRAGNMSVSETNVAISPEDLQPVVRIREVHPLDRSAETPPQRYFYR